MVDSCGAAGVRTFVHCYRVPAERNRDDFGDYEGIYRDGDGRDYRARLVSLEASGVRVSRVEQCGSVEMEGAWRDDALAAVFAWGNGNAADGPLPAAPSLLVWGPGSAIRIAQRGTSRNIRVGLRGRALEALMADPRLASGRRRWLRPELMRPRVSPAAERQLQERIVLATRFAEQALAHPLQPRAALGVAVDEVVGALVATLEAAGPEPRVDTVSPPSRRRLVDDALVLLDAQADEPVSVAALCRRLAVSERTLQRGFADRFGMSLREFERERRLRAVHGAILAEGDHRSITDIAMSFGFWHLGRFAGAYAAMFGCTPVETRRRIWGHTAGSLA